MRLPVLVLVASTAIARAECPRGERARFALLDAAHRADAAKVLAGALPGHAAVELDATGMVDRIAFDVQGQRSGDDLRGDVLAIVRAQPCAFGVVNASDLEARTQARAILVVEKSRGIGAVRVTIATVHNSTHVEIRGHLWPVPALAKVDTKAAIAAFAGRGARATRREVEIDPLAKEPGVIVEHIALAASDLVARSGPIVVCRKGFAEVRGGVLVDLAPRRRGNVEGPVPAAVDVHGRSIGDAWLAPSVVDPGADWVQADAASDAGRTCFGL